jgi:hypothetical protein
MSNHSFQEKRAAQTVQSHGPQRRSFLVYRKRSATGRIGPRFDLGGQSFNANRKIMRPDIASIEQTKAFVICRCEAQR